MKIQMVRVGTRASYMRCYDAARLEVMQEAVDDYSCVDIYIHTGNEVTLERVWHGEDRGEADYVFRGVFDAISHLLQSNKDVIIKHSIYDDGESIRVSECGAIVAHFHKDSE